MVNIKLHETNSQLGKVLLESEVTTDVKSLGKFEYGNYSIAV